MLTYSQALAICGLMLAVNLGIAALAVRALRRQARGYRRSMIRATMNTLETQ